MSPSSKKKTSKKNTSFSLSTGRLNSSRFVKYSGINRYNCSLAALFLRLYIYSNSKWCWLGFDRKAKRRSQIQNTKPPQSLYTENYSNFTHPPKTGCQNPCWCGFFILKKKSTGEVRKIKERREEKLRNGGRAREAREGEERKKRNSEAVSASRRTLAELCSAPWNHW